jgi:hypothetical protein
MATAKDIDKLDKKITDLSAALATLGRGTDFKELIRIIHNPGWTTPAELKLTFTVLETMQAQVSQLTKLSDALMMSARKVGSRG